MGIFLGEGFDPAHLTAGRCDASSKPTDDEVSVALRSAIPTLGQTQVTISELSATARSILPQRTVAASNPLRPSAEASPENFFPARGSSFSFAPRRNPVVDAFVEQPGQCGALRCGSSNPVQIYPGQVCWCDSACIRRGDCCRDYTRSCALAATVTSLSLQPEGQGICSGICGSATPQTLENGFTLIFSFFSIP